MSDNLRMRRELVEAYRAYQEDPYEPLLLQNYIRLLSRYKTDPETVDFLKNMRRWSGSKIVYDYVVYEHGESRDVFVGVNLQPPTHSVFGGKRVLDMGNGWSGYYEENLDQGLRALGPPENPRFVREELKRNSVFWTEHESFVLVNAETWPGDRVPHEVSSFFDSPYHGEVNLVSVHGSGEIRRMERPRDITDLNPLRAQNLGLSGVSAALAFGLMWADMTYGSYLEVEVPEP